VLPTLPMIFGYADDVAPRKWILDDAHCVLRPNFRTLSRRDLDVGKIRRHFVMQCKSFFPGWPSKKIESL
jgi:hypothetical protein